MTGNFLKVEPTLGQNENNFRFPLTKNGNGYDDAKNRPIVKVRQTAFIITTTPKMTVNCFEGPTHPWPKRNAGPFPLTKNGNGHDGVIRSTNLRGDSIYVAYVNRSTNGRSESMCYAYQLIRGCTCRRTPPVTSTAKYTACEKQPARSTVQRYVSILPYACKI